MTTVEDAEGSTQLFAVFVLSLVSIVLVPYTLHRLFGGENADDKEVLLLAYFDVFFFVFCKRVQSGNFFLSSLSSRFFPNLSLSLSLSLCRSSLAPYS